MRVLDWVIAHAETTFSAKLGERMVALMSAAGNYKNGSLNMVMMSTLFFGLAVQVPGSDGLV